MQGSLPLNGLKAFEAAARHLSFTRAAAELHVTQAAVSHQVKTLELRLGVKLFRRLPKSLLLTDEGQALLPDLRGHAVEALRAVLRPCQNNIRDGACDAAIHTLHGLQRDTGRSSQGTGTALAAASHGRVL